MNIQVTCSYTTTRCYNNKSTTFLFHRKQDCFHLVCVPTIFCIFGAQKGAIMKISNNSRQWLLYCCCARCLLYTTHPIFKSAMMRYYYYCCWGTPTLNLNVMGREKGGKKRRKKLGKDVLCPTFSPLTDRTSTTTLANP